MNAVRKEIFEPEALSTLGSVFDETWAGLSVGLGAIDDATREQIRLRLAGILMELAKPGVLNSEEMKSAAIRVFSQFENGRWQEKPAALELPACSPN